MTSSLAAISGQLRKQSVCMHVCACVFDDWSRDYQAFVYSVCFKCVFACALRDQVSLIHTNNQIVD
jgi:hypothetical protein